MLQGFNDLTTTHPDLAQQWNYEKNGNLTPYQVSCNSHRNVWRMCDMGHTWVSNVYSRKIGNGCPECSKRCIVSSVEDDIADYVESILDNDTTIIRSDRTVIRPKELDIYIPDHNLAIEFFTGIQKKRKEIKTITTINGKIAKVLEFNSSPFGRMNGKISKIL